MCWVLENSILLLLLFYSTIFLDEIISFLSLCFDFHCTWLTNSNLRMCIPKREGDLSDRYDLYPSEAENSDSEGSDFDGDFSGSSIDLETDNSLGSFDVVGFGDENDSDSPDTGLDQFGCTTQFFIDLGLPSGIDIIQLPHFHNFRVLVTQDFFGFASAFRIQYQAIYWWSGYYQRKYIWSPYDFLIFLFLICIFKKKLNFSGSWRNSYRWGIHASFWSTHIM